MSLKRTVAKVVISGVLLCNLLVPAASALGLPANGGHVVELPHS